MRGKWSGSTCCRKRWRNSSVERVQAGAPGVPVIADGHAMRVTCEVIQQLARPGKRGLRIDHPVFLLPLSQATVARLGIGQLRGNVQVALHQQRRQAVQILRTKHLAEPAHGKEEFTAASDPPRAVIGQSAGSDQAMHMEVGPQLLVPRVQHERETDFATQLLAAKLQQRLSRRVKQQLEQGALVALAVQDQPVQLMRQREHVVKVRHR